MQVDLSIHLFILTCIKYLILLDNSLIGLKKTTKIPEYGTVYSKITMLGHLHFHDCTNVSDSKGK